MLWNFLSHVTVKAAFHVLPKRLSLFVERINVDSALSQMQIFRIKCILDDTNKLMTSNEGGVLRVGRYGDREDSWLPWFFGFCRRHNVWSCLESQDFFSAFVRSLRQISFSARDLLASCLQERFQFRDGARTEVSLIGVLQSETILWHRCRNPFRKKDIHYNSGLPLHR